MATTITPTLPLREYVDAEAGRLGSEVAGRLEHIANVIDTWVERNRAPLPEAGDARPIMPGDVVFEEGDARPVTVECVSWDGYVAGVTVGRAGTWWSVEDPETLTHEGPAACFRWHARTYMPLPDEVPSTLRECTCHLRSTGPETNALWSHEDFYARARAVGAGDADLFLCLEDGRTYCPGEHELFRWE